jgi:Flp pilus assembly protein TadG
MHPLPPPADAKGMTSEAGQAAAAGGERGQAIVEFAIVVPLLVLTLTAILQFGIAFTHYVTITEAARNGARAAVVARADGLSAMEDRAEAAARRSAPDLQDDAGFRVVTSAPDGAEAGRDVTVTVEAPLRLSLIGLPVVNTTMESRTTMRIE